MCSPAVLRDADFNQSMTKIGITRPTRVLRNCSVCPQNVKLPISIWLYSTKITSFFYILKTKLIRTFMNGNNSLTLGLCCKLTTSLTTPKTVRCREFVLDNCSSLIYIKIHTKHKQKKKGLSEISFLQIPAL